MNTEELVSRIEDMLDQIESLATTLRESLDELNNVPDYPHEGLTESLAGFSTEPYEGEVLSNSEYLVGNSKDVWVRDVTNVKLQISGAVDTVNIINSSNVEVFGSGSVGKIHVQSFSSNIHVHDLSVKGDSWQGYGFNFNGGGENILIERVTALCDAYSIWAENVKFLTVRDCDFESLDQGNGNVEAVVRLVNCTDVYVVDTQFTSDVKHCFRVHGNSERISVTNSSIGGEGNGVMLGGNGEDVRDIEFVDCQFIAEGPDLLNVDDTSVSNLTIVKCSFTLRHGWDPVDHVTNNIPGTYSDIEKIFV